MEPKTIILLAEAAVSLLAAQKNTQDGFISDYIDNALDDLRKAIVSATALR